LNFPTQKLNEKLRDIENGINFYGIEKMLPAFFNNLSSILELMLATCNSDQLPQIIFDNKDAIFLRLKEYEEATERLYEQAILRQELLFPPHDYLISTKYLHELLTQFSIADLSTFAETSSMSFAAEEVSDIRQDIIHSMASAKDKAEHLLSPLAKRIKELHQEGIAVFVVLSSREHEAELKRLAEPFSLNLNSFKGKPDWFLGGEAFYKPHIHAFSVVTKTPLAFGAFLKFLKIAIIAEDDIFGHRTKRKGASGKQQGFATALSELEIGDLVVHVDHGIGRFAGLVRLIMRGIENDYILLTYANDEKLYLPVHRINMIKPHGGVKDGSVRVDKLGGTAWQSKKSKVKEAVMAMAQDLIKLYAKRSIVERPPFIAPDTYFHEFEAAFQFDCTPDQQKAIDDVLNDMQRKQPMDRLVCGDVGYGKTEVAMRASMLAVLSKRQVAILAPTTVLAQQHGITLRERFKNTGANIAVLSRFQKASEIKAILEEVKNNKIDVVIGTHRLLSPDVQFYDLGLLVVDEEQRFGIKAKEHLKKMRSKVDVMAM
ncbi:MAG TPA: DEAD/DEAH box helicase, partial [Myxococcota bacterium]|nr:DEAD/DEAH box helicase [Myxococcota bacterium]